MVGGGDSDLLARLARIREDPWEFLTSCVFTLDQADEAMPIKKFPAYPYLKLYCRIWQKEKRILVPKSRRMFMSWMNLGLFLWDTMWHVGRAQAFVSKKEDDANELLKKCVFILEHIPPDIVPPELIPKWHHVFGKLSFEEINSNISGYPQGADQLRQFTLSGILADEMAFWSEAEAMYASSMPTLEGGGRFTGISSPAPGFFRRLVHDELDNQSVKVGDTNLEKRFPIPGVEIWKNPKNKFFCFQLHYSANPAKADPKYREGVKADMPLAKYMQEYELQWDSFEGKPVYPDFSKHRHGTHRIIDPVVGLPLLRGWDFGLTPACIIAQYVGEQLFVLHEFTAENMGADRFSTIVLNQCHINWPRWADNKVNWRDYIDPSGFFRNEDQEGTCAKVLDGKGLSCLPGPVVWETRRSAVEQLLTKQTKAGPGLVICIPTCPVSIAGFEGGYRYPEKSFDLEPGKIRPLKDKHSHPQDGLQYIAAAIIKMTKRKHVKMSDVSYGFQQRSRLEATPEIAETNIVGGP